MRADPEPVKNGAFAIGKRPIGTTDVQGTEHAQLLTLSAAVPEGLGMACANPLLDILDDLVPSPNWREVSFDLPIPGFHFTFMEPGSKRGLVLLGKLLNDLFESCQCHRNIPMLERETGLEPATSSLGSWHSTTELLPLSEAGLYHDGLIPAAACRGRVC